MSTAAPHKNMSLDDAIRTAADLGADVRQGKGGEIVVTIPGRHPLRLNSRRKDAPQGLVSRLRQAMRRKARPQPRRMVLPIWFDGWTLRAIWDPPPPGGRSR
jgi:hypothetical protein